METEKFSVRAESAKMNSPDAIASNVQEWLRAIADAFGRISLKEAFNRLARVTGLTIGQVKRLYYGEWRIIPAHVFLAVAKAYKTATTRIQRYAEHQHAIWAALNKEWDDEWADTSSSGEQPSPESGQTSISVALSP